MAATSDPNSPQTVVTRNTPAGSLSYPSEIKGAAHYCTLTFSKYQRQKPSSNAQQTITSTIVLPLPTTGFGDTQQVAWNGHEMGLVGTELSDIAEAGRAGMRVGRSILNDIFSNGEYSEAAKTAARAAAITAVATMPKDMRDTQIGRRLSQEFGIIQNPHLVAQMEGVGLRAHQLEWHFSPRTEQEAVDLGKIINQIRYLSLPSYTNVLSKFTLNYADTVEVTFKGVDENYKTKINRSGITNFATNFGGSTLAMYRGGRPVEIQMAVSLIELEITTREDYKSST